MVKIDAEGFDLKVLAGASDLLAKTDIFLVEAVVWGVGAGRAYDNSVAEVVSFMAKADYNLECALDSGQFQAAVLTGAGRGDPRIARGSDSLARSGVCECCKPRR